MRNGVVVLGCRGVGGLRIASLVGERQKDYLRD